MGAKLKGVITTSVVASAGLLLAVQEEAYAQWAATFTPVQFGVPQEQQQQGLPPTPLPLQQPPVWCVTGEVEACIDIENFKNMSQLALQKIAAERQEPYIGNFLQIYRNCDQSIDNTAALGRNLDTIKTQQCRTAIGDAENTYCGIRNYDNVICGYITILKRAYELKVLLLSS